jgi:hypothetical protein
MIYFYQLSYIDRYSLSSIFYMYIDIYIYSMYRNVVDSLYIGKGIKTIEGEIATLSPLAKRDYLQIG